MTKSAADVELEVEESRERLDATVEALKDKMNPGQLFDEASQAMSGAAQQLLPKIQELLPNVLAQAKANPLPLAVVGVGLTWLAMSLAKSSATANTSSAANSGTGIGGALHTVQSKATEVFGGAKDAVTDRAASAQDAMGDVVHSLSDRAAPIVNKATGFGQTGLQSVKNLIEREPILLGAVGVIVGVGIAAALPSTPLEDKAIGPAHDGLIEKGKIFAHEGLDKASETAQAAFVAAKTEVRKVFTEGAGAMQGA